MTCKRRYTRYGCAHLCSTSAGHPQPNSDAGTRTLRPMTLLYRLCLPSSSSCTQTGQIMSRQSNSLLYKHGGLRLVAAGRPSRWQQYVTAFCTAAKFYISNQGITL